VPVARLSPGRFRRLAREVTAFGLVGLANTVLDFAVFNGLIFLGPLKANAASTLIATTSSYVMNRHWTYRDRPKTALRREYTLFFVFNLIGLAIQEAVLGLAKYGLGFGEHDSRFALNLFKCLGVGVAMVFRFWAYRTIVFRRAPAPAAEPVPAMAVAPVSEPVPADEFTTLTAPLEAELDEPTEADLDMDEVELGAVDLDEVELDAARLDTETTPAAG
jgi:putative flippase GtrA